MLVCFVRGKGTDQDEFPVGTDNDMSICNANIFSPMVSCRDQTRQWEMPFKAMINGGLTGKSSNYGWFSIVTFDYWKVFVLFLMCWWVLLSGSTCAMNVVCTIQHPQRDNTYHLVTFALHFDVPWISESNFDPGIPQNVPLSMGSCVNYYQWLS
jgi:hypothetical protein